MRQAAGVAAGGAFDGGGGGGGKAGAGESGKHKKEDHGCVVGFVGAVTRRRLQCGCREVAADVLVARRSCTVVLLQLAMLPTVINTGDGRKRVLPCRNEGLMSVATARRSSVDKQSVAGGAHTPVRL